MELSLLILQRMEPWAVGFRRDCSKRGWILGGMESIYESCRSELGTLDLIGRQKRSRQILWEGGAVAIQ